MRTRKHGLDEKEMELVKLLMSECKTTADIQSKLKRLFAGTIEQMLETEMKNIWDMKKIQPKEIIQEIAEMVMVKRQ